MGGFAGSGAIDKECEYAFTAVIISGVIISIMFGILTRIFGVGWAIGIIGGLMVCNLLSVLLVVDD